MLGSIGYANAWHWAAWGKHPVARDYVRIGTNDSLVQAFYEWVEKGYEILISQGRSSSHLSSWRFWARGVKRKALICGVGRDSSDSIGRPYPLLIMGTGHLEGWEDEWDLLPVACENTWSQIEHLSAKRFADLRQLEEEVRNIRAPYPVWSEFMSQKKSRGKGSPAFDHETLSWDMKDLVVKLARLSEEKDLFASLDGGPSDDPHILAALWHALLKTRTSNIPNAVFMGGTPEGTYLAVFKRALAPGDFVRLWSVFSSS